jgi:pyruvate dehydrogenase (quinone)
MKKAAGVCGSGSRSWTAVVARRELAMPLAIATEVAKGFTLYMVKAALSGRTDQLIDLAQGNLWR